MSHGASPLAAFHRVGDRSRLPAVAATVTLRPALFAAYHDLSRLRSDFPVVMTEKPGAGPWAVSLADLVDGLLRQVTQPGTADEEVRRHLLAVEGAVRRSVQSGQVPSQRASRALHTSWNVPRYGDLPAKVDQMIQAGRIPEIIMVHPRGDNSFYCNFADGTKKYEDFVVKEVAAHVESHYRVRKDRASRAIAGTSMGGYGALQIAMKYPEQYSAAAGHSPIILLARNPQDVPEELKAARFYQFFMSVLKPVFGDPIRQDLWDASNPLVLARKGNLKQLRIFIDYGTEDRYIQTIHLDQGVKALAQALTESGVPHAFKEYAGEPHGWALVAAHLENPCHSSVRASGDGRLPA